MKLIVGLGNPGRKYEGTRHNVGFLVVAELARRHATAAVKQDFQAEVVAATIAGERALLVCPQTFMNRSGGSVVRARDFYKVEPQDLLVVCDDLNLPLAKLRFRIKGSAGGQKGLADIIRCLGTEEFPRLRIGIGSPPDHWDAADFVLGKFNKQEQHEMDFAVQYAADAAQVWVRDGSEACMNQYNNK